MKATVTLNDKYEVEAATPTVRAFHAAIRARMAEQFEASGQRWEEFVLDPQHELSFEDLAAVEREMLDAGYRFDFSAQVSPVYGQFGPSRIFQPTRSFPLKIFRSS